MTKTTRVPVLIVGGGGAGLTASMLLSRLGVRRFFTQSDLLHDAPRKLPGARGQIFSEIVYDLRPAVSGRS